MAFNLVSDYARIHRWSWSEEGLHYGMDSTQGPTCVQGQVGHGVVSVADVAACNTTWPTLFEKLYTRNRAHTGESWLGRHLLKIQIEHTGTTPPLSSEWATRIWPLAIDVCWEDTFSERAYVGLKGFFYSVDADSVVIKAWDDTLLVPLEILEQQYPDWHTRYAVSLAFEQTPGERAKFVFAEQTPAQYPGTTLPPELS